jgi:GAF domain-containing protein
MPETDLDKANDQTHTTNGLAELADSECNLTEFFRHAVDLIVKHLRFAHAGVFLLNETGDFAVLQATSAAIGEMQNPNDYRLPIDSTSVVGWVAMHNELKVVTDASQASPPVKSDLFPSVECKVGVPISLNGTLFGVLCVHHYHSEALDTDAIATLQAIAKLIAFFTQQSKLFEATRNHLRQNTLILEIARQQAERERVASEITSKLWSSTDIHAILRTAIHELSQHLEADEGMIRLQLPDSQQTSALPANNGHKGGTA